MDLDEKAGMREEARCEAEFTCSSCGDKVSGYAAIDPIEIDGRLFCDYCGNNYINLRFDGYLNDDDGE